MKDLRGGAALEPVALVRPLEVVEPQVAVEVALLRCHRGVVRAPERAAPQLGEDRPLQPFDESVGPGMPGPGAAVFDPEPETVAMEGILPLRAVIGQDGVQGVTGPAVE